MWLEDNDVAMKYDIFISYSRADLDEVASMLNLIKSQIPDLSIWIDLDDIEIGDEYEDIIVSAIDESAYVIVALSNNSSKSDWVKDEVRYALRSGKKVIPVLLKGAEMKGWFLLKLARVDCINLSNSLQTEKLIRNLSQLTGKERVGNSLYQQRVEQYKSHQFIQHEPLCPCGSGQIFRECHGKYDVSYDEAESHNEIKNAWEVGDYYNENGMEGVVYWVDETGQHGKIVGLNEAKLKWCADDEFERAMIKTGASDKSDGMNNLRAIMRIPDWRTRFPAFSWCTAHGQGWYLPSLNEMEDILLDDEVHNKVNISLVSKGASRLRHRNELVDYWSSTENGNCCAWLVYMNVGYTYFGSRNTERYVRAVSTF